MVEVRHGAREPVEEGEIVTEENVFDRYDEPQGFFPGSFLIAFGDVIIPFLFVILLLAIPWLDTEPAHSTARRPFVVVIGFLVIIVIVLNMLLALVRIANFPGGTPAG